MNSLFWKIFISFWLSLILFASLTLWSTSHYLDSVRAKTQQAQPRHNIRQYTEQAKDIARQHGIEGLRVWLKYLDKHQAIPYLLVDEKGNDLIGRQVPLHLQQRILKNESHSQGQDHENNHYRPHNLLIINNHRYRFIADFQSVTLGRILSRPSVIAIPIIIAILISAIVCLLLARYLTSPIGKLRKATNKLAAGDLTQRVAASMGNRKDEIVDLANDFDHMAEQLQSLVTSHKQLLRDASHELRSPLARLQVALGLARQRSSQDTVAEFDRIERETERLNELIGQLLSLARLESGNIKLQNEPLDLTSLLEDIAQDAAYEARATNRDVKIVHSIPASINGNAILLHSALDNIIRNAIRYTDENTCIELSLSRDSANENQVVIKVRDHGPGIPDDMLTRIFEPFVRVSEARDRISGGYGLGLAIASRAITLHGGKMSAQNETDKGLSIIVHLPT
jgi:two-component system sensor histidine kinase CpxA